MTTTDPDTERGLYHKYEVRKLVYGKKWEIIGLGPEGRWVPHITYKEADGRCFVLDFDNDPHARVALRAYAQSCANDYPELANDLMHQLDSNFEFRDGRAVLRGGAADPT